MQVGVLNSHSFACDVNGAQMTARYIADPTHIRLPRLSQQRCNTPRLDPRIEELGKYSINAINSSTFQSTTGSQTGAAVIVVAFQ